jgi:hypothetical protein
LFAFTTHIAGRATAIAPGKRLQSLTLVHCNDCLGAKAPVIAVSTAIHTGSECDEVQIHLFFLRSVHFEGCNRAAPFSNIALLGKINVLGKLAFLGKVAVLSKNCLHQ